MMMMMELKMIFCFEIEAMCMCMCLKKKAGSTFQLQSDSQAYEMRNMKVFRGRMSTDMKWIVLLCQDKN